MSRSMGLLAKFRAIKSQSGVSKSPPRSQENRLPLLATGAALEIASVLTLLGTTISTHVDRSVEVAPDALDGGVLLCDLLADRHLFKSHPGDLGFLVVRIASIDGKVQALRVEGVRDAVAVFKQSFAKASLADWGKAAFLVASNEFLTTPIRDLTTKLHSTGSE